MLPRLADKPVSLFNSVVAETPESSRIELAKLGRAGTIAVMKKDRRGEKGRIKNMGGGGIEFSEILNCDL